MLDSGQLVVATDGGSFWLVDVATETCEECYFYHSGSPVPDETVFGGVQAVSPHPTRNAVFASVGEDKLLGVWDGSQRKRMLTGHLPEMARALDWSPDGNHIAVGFVGGHFGVYDANTMMRVAWHHRAQEAIDVVRFSPDGRQVATGSHENVIDLYDVRKNFHHRKRLTGHSSSIKKLDWSEDSKILQVEEA